MNVKTAVILNQLREGALGVGPAGVRVIDAPHDKPWTRAAEADVLLTAPRNGWAHAPASAPPGWPGRLRWVHTASAGIDYFPKWLFEVPVVTCARGVMSAAIAEYVIWSMLEHNKCLARRHVNNEASWRAEVERVDAAPLPRLQGQTLGLVGFGAIGQAVAERALPFGMRVQALRRTHAPMSSSGVETADSLPQLLESSDHVVLAVPNTTATQKILNAAMLARAKSGLHIVNIARGSLIDQEALIAALDSGHISGVTLDVADPEPLPSGHRLYTHPKVRLTPHISWSSDDLLERSVDHFQDNLHRFLAGRPLNDVVDVARGY